MGFKPVILGTEIGAYAMARAFNEEYGIKSDIVGRMQLSATKFSGIVEPHVVEDLTDPDTFRSALLDLGRQMAQANPGDVLLLIPCGDDYSALISRFADDLGQYFTINTVPYELHKKLSYKTTFYEMCDTYDLPHPATFVLDPAGAKAGAHHELPFDLPVALKPANSVEYLSIDFEGRKKAYIIHTPEELDQVVTAIFGAGYTSELIIQDFIPGGGENMRVLNAYVGSDHKVRSMVLGHVLMEDPTPYAIGNYAAIIPDENDAICQRLTAFLEKIEYAGVANFDMKYDERDGEYKLFEINLRQGRTNYFATANGMNVAKCFVDDLVEHKPSEGPKIIKGDCMLLEIPAKTLRKYCAEGEAKDRGLAMISAHKYEWTLRYTRDLSMARRALLVHMANLTGKNYDTYLGQ